MTKDEEPTPTELADVRAEDAALVAEDEAELAWLENHYRRHHDLLAWIIRQDVQPQDLRNEENWPNECDAISLPALLWLARRDPAIRALATAQLAEDLRLAAEDEGFSLGPDKLLLAAEFLTSRAPARRGPWGDDLGRNVVLHSLMTFFEDEGWNPWRLEGKAPLPSEEERADFIATGERLWLLPFRPASLTSLAEMLADDLAAHPLLDELPEAVPSVEAIRGVWKSWLLPDGCPNAGRVF